MTRDPYIVLGVSRNASKEDIKRAFLKLAHVHHPDKGGNAETFKEVSAAYASLKDVAAGNTSSNTRSKGDYEFWDEAANMGNAGFWQKNNRAYDDIFKNFAENAARQYQQAREEQARKESSPRWKILRKQIDLAEATIRHLQKELDGLQDELDNL